MSKFTVNHIPKNLHMIPIEEQIGIISFLEDTIRYVFTEFNPQEPILTINVNAEQALSYAKSTRDRGDYRVKDFNPISVLIMTKFRKITCALPLVSIKDINDRNLSYLSFENVKTIVTSTFFSGNDDIEISLEEAFSVVNFPGVTSVSSRVVINDPLPNSLMYKFINEGGWKKLWKERIRVLLSCTTSHLAVISGIEMARINLTEVVTGLAGD